jgi:hypothetical protein
MCYLHLLWMLFVALRLLPARFAEAITGVIGHCLSREVIMHSTRGIPE